ncbi:histidine--tRNA ligase [Desulfallas thermosapovorans]|uniref:Histidine--tRNA ligase n=1 Tax=Desulfallas thermosapovorans DSM 6562 TaxID=1121431 RepID=A0A5S4ZQL4_9FIRM|nr:histidine--tRNA ligase [Desulfallas thermosapovorans]TYO95097.1 histidyl-tRNA synthetase [Desulfallas thermosapovorans DSM 6562]
MLTTRPRGTADILPGQVEKWQYIEEVAARVCREYGYREIRTPIFEHTELFVRGVGESTDIVEKEMYTFQDRGQRSITLRPEGTASVVRAYLENKLYAGPLPVKTYYIGPMFRYDRPQAGRYRQFHQFGIEVFGARQPAMDAEVMALAMDFYGRLGLDDLELHINSLGCPACRNVVRERLQQFFRPVLGELCPNCQGRYERNPLRILDCKSNRCTELALEAPTTADCLCPRCREHFEQVQQYMRDLDIPYVLDKRLVRGLDYYTHTAFEIMAPGIGAQSSVGGGGRYDGLVEACGGPPTPGIGFALGLERILLALEKRGKLPVVQAGPEVFLVAVGDRAYRESFSLLARLRAAGIAADMDYQGRSPKAQMKYAGKLGVRYAVIMGEEELQRGSVVLRDMAAGSQRDIPVGEVIGALK